MCTEGVCGVTLERVASRRLGLFFMQYNVWFISETNPGLCREQAMKREEEG